MVERPGNNKELIEVGRLVVTGKSRTEFLAWEHTPWLERLTRDTLLIFSPLKLRGGPTSCAFTRAHSEAARREAQEVGQGYGRNTRASKPASVGLLR